MISRLNRRNLSVNCYYPGEIFCLIEVVAMSNDLRRMIGMKNQGRVWGPFLKNQGPFLYMGWYHSHFSVNLYYRGEIYRIIRLVALPYRD